jgi:hypothetical protein
MVGIGKTEILPAEISVLAVSHVKLDPFAIEFLVDDETVFPH